MQLLNAMFKSNNKLYFFVPCILLGIVIIPFVSSVPNSKKSLFSLQNAATNEPRPKFQGSFTVLNFNHLAKKFKLNDLQSYENLKTLRDQNKEIMKVQNAMETSALDVFKQASEKLEKTMVFEKENGRKISFNIRESAKNYDFRFLKYIFREEKLRLIAKNLMESAEYMLRHPYSEMKLPQNLINALLRPEDEKWGTTYKYKLIRFTFLKGYFSAVMEDFLSPKEINAEKSVESDVLVNAFDTEEKKQNLYAFLNSLHGLLVFRSHGIVLSALQMQGE